MLEVPGRVEWHSSGPRRNSSGFSDDAYADIPSRRMCESGSEHMSGAKQGTLFLSCPMSVRSVFSLCTTFVRWIIADDRRFAGEVMSKTPIPKPGGLGWAVCAGPSYIFCVIAAPEAGGEWWRFRGAREACHSGLGAPAPESIQVRSHLRDGYSRLVGRRPPDRDAIPPGRVNENPGIGMRAGASRFSHFVPVLVRPLSGRCPASVRSLSGGH